MFQTVDQYLNRISTELYFLRMRGQFFRLICNSLKMEYKHSAIYSIIQFKNVILLCFILTINLSAAGNIDRINSKKLHHLTVDTPLQINVVKSHNNLQISCREDIMKLQKQIDQLKKENAELKDLKFQQSNDHNQIFI